MQVNPCALTCLTFKKAPGVFQAPRGGTVLPAVAAFVAHPALYVIAQCGQFVAQLAAFLLGENTVRLVHGLMALNPALAAVQSFGVAGADKAGANTLVNTLGDI